MRSFIAKHPKELWILSLSELCERFSFWGVGNLLVLYLIEYYHLPNAEATGIYAIFSGCATFLPFVGGYLADKWNYQSPLVLGAVFNALGCFFLAAGHPLLFYLALVIIAAGYGIFTPSLVTALSHSYRNTPHLREAGFSIYYASINIGVFLALVSLGTVAKLYSWPAAFFLAGVVQVLGLIPIAIYLLCYREHYSSLKNLQRSAHEKRKPLLKMEKDRLWVLAVFCLVSILFWMAYNQAYSSMAIFAHQFMNRKVGAIEVPEGIFLSSEAFFLILLAPILAALYARLQKSHNDPSPATKTALSLFAIAACFIVMMIGSSQIPPHASSAHVSWTFLVGAYFLMALGEMLLAPIGLSLMGRLAPARFQAFGIGVWYLCVGIAYYSGGQLASLMGKIDSLFHFFAIFVALTIFPGAFMLYFSKRLTRKSHLDADAL